MAVPPKPVQKPCVQHSQVMGIKALTFKAETIFEHLKALVPTIARVTENAKLAEFIKDAQEINATEYELLLIDTTAPHNIIAMRLGLIRNSLPTNTAGILRKVFEDSQGILDGRYSEEMVVIIARHADNRFITYCDGCGAREAIIRRVDLVDLLAAMPSQESRWEIPARPALMPSQYGYGSGEFPQQVESSPLSNRWTTDAGYTVKPVVYSFDKLANDAGAVFQNFPDLLSVSYKSSPATVPGNNDFQINEIGIRKIELDDNEDIADLMHLVPAAMETKMEVFRLGTSRITVVPKSVPWDDQVTGKAHVIDLTDPALIDSEGQLYGPVVIDVVFEHDVRGDFVIVTHKDYKYAAHNCTILVNPFIVHVIVRKPIL